jgi:glycerol-3-phosphate acyltransferase PlsY
VVLPPIAWMAGAPDGVVLAASATAGLILFRHRANVRRLASGTERKMGARA